MSKQDPNLPPGVSQSMIDEHFCPDCRNCGEELSEEEWESGHCPHCHENPNEPAGPDPDELYDNYRDNKED